MSNILAELAQSKADHQAALEKIKAIEKEKAWLQQRKSRFTASEYGRLMGYETDPKYNNVLTKGGESYAYDKYLESITTETDGFKGNQSTEHGNTYETEAAQLFMERTGIVLHHCGEEQEFIPFGKHLGCTPDGLIGEDRGFESKCPNSKTHDTYLRTITDVASFKKVCTDYYWQIQGSMYVTGRKAWYFVSYDPRFIHEADKLLILKIERNDADIDNLKNRLQLAIARKMQLLKQREQRLNTLD